MEMTPFDDRRYGFRIVGVEISDQLLDHDAPEQRRGEDEDLFFFLADFARLLQRPHDDEIGEQRGGKADADAERRTGIGADMQIVARRPGRDDGRDHQRAMGQIEDAGDAENQSKARGAERI